MRNPAWRDADYLGLYVTPSYMRWADESPLEPFRRPVLASLSAFRKAKGDDSDAAWLRAVRYVDQLIVDAERKQGDKIRAL
ncbi:MAG: hypothetical protein ABIQ73_00285 [Acidimicrobiales bacterium]